MKSESGEFKTCTDRGLFGITICQESDLSDDGGYTFGSVTNTYELDKVNAQHLIDELQYFIDR